MSAVYAYYAKRMLEKYAREHDLLDVMPVCCDIDYESAKFIMQSFTEDIR